MIVILLNKIVITYLLLILEHTLFIILIYYTLALFKLTKLYLTSLPHR